MFRKILFSIVFILSVVVSFFIFNVDSKALAQGLAQGWACRWESSGKIKCFAETKLSSTIGGVANILDRIQLSPSEVPGAGGLGAADISKWDEAVLGAAAGETKDEDDFFYDPGWSASNGYPTFCGGNKIGNAKCIHFVTNNPLLGLMGADEPKRTPEQFAESDQLVPLGGLKNALINPLDNDCGITRPGKCQVHDADYYDGNGLNTTTFQDNTKALLSTQALKEACEAQGGAPLSFITCPIFNGIVDAITALIGGEGTTGPRQGLLIDFLTIDPIKGTKVDANGNPIEADVMQSFVKQVVDVANLVFVVIFLLLIFSSSLPLGLDNYTVKKMLPKFIIAVILTQFSFFISRAVIDFFNLLGHLVPNVIFALQLNTAAPSAQSTATSLLHAGLYGAIIGGLSPTLFVSVLPGVWLFLIIIAIIALVAVLVGFIYMAIRYLIIYILVIIAPLAFAAWVLPGTEKFFSSWWKNFIRINAVFPMITGMLAIAVVLSRVLTASDASGITKLIGMMIPVIALFMIPKTLKWTTQGMNTLAAGALGFTAGKMGGGAKAVGGAAKAGGKKAYSEGKSKSFEFGTRKAAQHGLLGKNKSALEHGKAINKEQDLVNQRLTGKTLEETEQLTEASVVNLASKRNDAKAIGSARAHLHQLIEAGDSKGVAKAMKDFQAAGRAQGMSDDDIAKYWSTTMLSGSDFGAAKAMSPTLVPMTGADLGHVGSSGGINGDIIMTGGDYKGVGAAKLTELDPAIMEAHLTAGASASSLNFDQYTVETALQNPNTEWKNPELRTTMEKLSENAYASGEWSRPTPPTPPTPPPTGGAGQIPFNPNTERNPNNIPGSSGGSTGPEGLWTPGGHP